MEQTINLFSKGLQLDTNPMVQSNDTLSDALNTTFITQNGNEVVLLNDMGNRRVDNAFLPPGYEPVGIKEYGGIIYVASYNPITNKSLIGSFPSPERKISLSDDKDLGNTVDFIGDFRKSVKLNYGLYWLTTDTLLYPLTNKNSIHAGDKFVVYGFSDRESIKNVTNYNNIIRDSIFDKDMVETPLNKTYTLQLGILNSLNEFVDITRTLVRWDYDDHIILFKEGTTDLFKFNSGYFLADGTPDNSRLEETQNDSNFIKERNALKLALNTYAYKLVGPMYLKAILNHIESFDYNITGEYKDGVAYLKIEATIIYNCPHHSLYNYNLGGYRLTSEDSDYKYFDDGTIYWDNFFDFYFGDKDHNNSKVIIPDSLEYNGKPTSTTFGTVYNKTTNLYTTKIVKEYSNIRNTDNWHPIMTEEDEEYDGDKIYYILGVCTPLMEYLEETPVYLEGLSIVDVLNLSLLGSGKISSKEWRFTNSYTKDSNNNIIDGNTKLLYNLESYPRENLKFVNLQMELYEVRTPKTISAVVKLSEEVSNGRNEVTFSWKHPNSLNNPNLIDGEINPRKLYYVILKYLIKDNSGNYWKYNDNGEQVPATSLEFISTDLEKEKIWFLSTPLFNVCYNQSSSDYIRCYFNPRSKKENNTIKKLCKVNVKLVPNDNIISNNEIKETQGKLLTNNRTDPNFETITTKSIKFEFNPEIIIEKEEDYPDYVMLDNEKVNLALSGLNYETIYEYKELLYLKNENNLYINEKGESLIEKLNNSISVFESSNYSGRYKMENFISINTQQNGEITIINKDRLLGTRETSNGIKIRHAFNNFYNSIEKSIVNKLMDTELGAGITINRLTELDSACSIGLVCFDLNYYENTPYYYGSEHIYDNKSLGYFGIDLNKVDIALEHGGVYNLQLSKNVYDNYILLYNGSYIRDLGYDSKATYIIKNKISEVYHELSKRFPKNNINSDFLFIFSSRNYNSIEHELYLTNNLPPHIPHYNHSTIDVSNKINARVLWRTTNDEDGEWALIYSPLVINANYASNKEHIKGCITSFLDTFIEDFIYCYSNEISLLDAGLWTYINNYCYNKYYNFLIKLYKKINCNVDNILKDFNIKEPLNFVCEQELNESSKYIQYNIKSDEDFSDSVSNIGLSLFENIYIGNGKSKDKYGYTLDIDKLYTINNEELEKISSDSKLFNCIKIDTNDTYTYNKVLYNSINNSYNLDCPKYRYDWRHCVLLEEAFGVNYNIDYKGTLVTPETLKY